MDDLNSDVVLLLIEAIDNQRDLSHLMRTSSSIYSLGIKRLLYHGGDITTDQQLFSFCSFILKDPTSRGPFLHKLRVSIPLSLWDPWECQEEQYVPEVLQGAPLLSTVLSHTCNLKTVVFDYLEELFERTSNADGHSALMNVFTRLSSLRSLHITHFGARVFQTVRHMTLPHLVSIELDFLRMAGENGPEWWADVLSVLSPFHGTLRSVTLANLTFEMAWGGVPKTFSHVRELTMTRPGVTPASFDLGVIARAFPNVRTLKVFGSFYLADEWTPMHNRAVAMEGLWDKLVEVTGPLGYLYCLAIRRPVRRLEVRDIALDRTALQWLKTVLEEMPPQDVLVLGTHVGWPDQHDYSLLPKLLASVNRYSLAGVRSLTLDLDCGTVEEVHPWRLLASIAVCWWWLSSHRTLTSESTPQESIPCILQRVPDISHLLVRLDNYPIDYDEDGEVMWMWEEDDLPSSSTLLHMFHTHGESEPAMCFADTFELAVQIIPLRSLCSVALLTPFIPPQEWQGYVPPGGGGIPVFKRGESITKSSKLSWLAEMLPLPSPDPAPRVTVPRVAKEPEVLFDPDYDSLKSKWRVSEEDEKAEDSDEQTDVDGDE